MIMKQKIINIFKESIAVKERFLDENIDTIIEVSVLLADTFSKGNKLILFGNGGSASDASHIAAEFVNRFKMERPAFPAIALNTDTAVLTSIANDYDYDNIFERQLKAFAQAGDAVIAISTSGTSPNVIKAVEAAKSKRLKTIVFTGAKGDKLASLADYVFAVPSDNTPRVQETHIVLGHVLCQMVEEIIFESHRKR
ncbi:MAG TPA: SIS domain-containing protein [Nitrospirae bacterium]|nr:SIS domain-containing protein [Nitrospirota bacterium]HDN94672.1 SIS domain-containing protein [Nitrospirota bacterium]HDO67363.1 SIS domain-containing protein [Nitrospirota bacterium]HDZ83613.1 SIS domain-containing protein [Nitrospirota bacterium]HEW81537.1 SIS domain-containing protein [Nitrospirota bacterium]